MPDNILDIIIVVNYLQLLRKFNAHVHWFFLLRTVVLEFTHLVQLVAKSDKRSFLTQHLCVLKHSSHDMRDVLETFLSQINRYFKFCKAESN